VLLRVCGLDSGDKTFGDGSVSLGVKEELSSALVISENAICVSSGSVFDLRSSTTGMLSIDADLRVGGAEQDVNLGGTFGTAKLTRFLVCSNTRISMPSLSSQSDLPTALYNRTTFVSGRSPLRYISLCTGTSLLTIVYPARIMPSGSKSTPAGRNVSNDFRLSVSCNHLMCTASGILMRDANNPNNARTEHSMSFLGRSVHRRVVSL